MVAVGREALRRSARGRRRRQPDSPQPPWRAGVHAPRRRCRRPQPSGGRRQHQALPHSPLVSAPRSKALAAALWVVRDRSSAVVDLDLNVRKPLTGRAISRLGKLAARGHSLVQQAGMAAASQLVGNVGNLVDDRKGVLALRSQRPWSSPPTPTPAHRGPARPSGPPAHAARPGTSST